MNSIIIHPLSSSLLFLDNNNNNKSNNNTKSPLVQSSSSYSSSNSLATESLIFLLLLWQITSITTTTITSSLTTTVNNNNNDNNDNNVNNNQTYLDEECHKQYIDIDDVENYKDLNFPGEFKEFGLDEYFKITLYVIAMLASLFGNFAVVLSVLLKRSLRVTVNLYLANLAVADILICVCCMWVHLVNHLTAPAFVLGPFLCKINSFAQMTCLTSSVLTLSAIACDRYMAIMYPLRTRVTKQRTGIVITLIWLISGIISIPFCLLRRYEKIEWKDYTQITCYEDWPYTIFYSPGQQGCDKKHSLKTFYYTLVATTLFFAPVFIMITAYSAIIWILWGSKLPGEANESNLRHQKKSKRKVIKMVVVVLLVFVICWLPLQIIVLYSVYFHSSNEMLPSWFGNLIFYSYFIAYSNSAFNPIIYGGFNKNFRDAIFRNKFCQSLWCLNNNSNNSSNGDRSRWQQPQYSTASMSTIVTSVNNRNGGGGGSGRSTYKTSLIKRNHPSFEPTISCSPSPNQSMKKDRKSAQSDLLFKQQKNKTKHQEIELIENNNNTNDEHKRIEQIKMMMTITDIMNIDNNNILMDNNKNSNRTSDDNITEMYELESMSSSTSPQHHHHQQKSSN